MLSLAWHNREQEAQEFSQTSFLSEERTYQEADEAGPEAHQWALCPE